MSKVGNILRLEVFLKLLQSGLWGRPVHLAPNGEIDFLAIQKMAGEQSVVGFVAAGIEVVQGAWLKEHGSPLVPKPVTLQFIGQTMMIEQQNRAMNGFVARLMQRLQEAGVKCVLVKGQGVAQCYERPLWRSSGDVDLLLDEENFERAFKLLSPLAEHVDREETYSRHIGMTIAGWVLELHGTLRCGLSKRMDGVIDELQDDCLQNGNVRTWSNGEADVLLPGVDNDILFIFTHFLKHFYKGGIGLRQICDWCRLLWTYREEIDITLLESRLRKMGLMTEWKAFGALAVEYLGLPKEAMPLLNDNVNLNQKAKRIMEFVMEVGNFGHNRDTSYYGKYPFVVRKAISMGWRLRDLCRHAAIFPLASLRFFPKLMYDGVRSAVKGE